MADFVRVARITDIPSDSARVFTVRGRRLALCHVDGTIYAVDDTCTHDGGPLGEGRLDNHAIECPRHGARFDVRTGAVVQMPAVFPIRTYPTRIENGEIAVDLGDGAV
ncbi:MAG: non-heme iron oxygenase ferredoxin subunit [Candidatus Zixiibacteriota bacterium]